MKKVILFYLFSLFTLIGVVTAKPGLAQTSTLDSEAARMNSLALSHGQSTVVGKISNQFDYFLKNVDSQQVITGLRNGQWTYTTTTTSSTGTPVQTTNTATFPTGKMGWGEVDISLALAQQRLNQYGITQPDSTQLSTALMGGEIVPGDPTTATTGILQMRADGMGWGQIAHQYNLNLGKVMSGIKSVNKNIAAGTTASTGKGSVSASGKTAGSTGSGMVTGGGKSLSGHGKGMSGSTASSEGIVTGSGQSTAGSVGGVVTGRGHAYGVGGGPGAGAGGHGKGPSK